MDWREKTRMTTIVAAHAALLPEQKKGKLNRLNEKAFYGRIH